MIKSIAAKELELLQQGKESSFWKKRLLNPLELGSWEELALAPTAWAWLSQIPGEYADQPEASIQKEVWSRFAELPITQEDVAHVDHALRSWNAPFIWTPQSVTNLVIRLENILSRPWHNDLSHHANGSFEYHLLHTLCVNISLFKGVKIESLWDSVNASGILRSNQKEILLMSLLKIPDERWPFDKKASGSAWYEQLKLVSPKISSLLTNMENIAKALDTELTRGLVVEQWSLETSNSRLTKQIESYNSLDLEIENVSPF